MKIIIVDDDNVSRRTAKIAITNYGYEVIDFANPLEAEKCFEAPNYPRIAILDWMMPEMSGIEFCRHIRKKQFPVEPFLIILTGTRKEKNNVVEAMRAGANDFIEKPFNSVELMACLKNAEQFVELKTALALRIKELEDANRHIKSLQGILPICMHCHKIRNDKESWEKLEDYLSDHTNAQLSHGLCPECMTKHYGKYMKEK